MSGFRVCGGLSLVAAFACGGAPEVARPVAPPSPVVVAESPVGNPAPAGDFSGNYGKNLSLVQGESTVLLSLFEVFGNAHICDCSVEGAMTSEKEYQFPGFNLKNDDGRVWLEGSPECCGAGFPGLTYRISEASPLQKCTVTVDKAPFYAIQEFGEVGVETGAYVVRGDVIEAGAVIGEHRMARFIGKKRTIGLLSTRDLACP